jgi:hypothetical protein
MTRRIRVGTRCLAAAACILSGLFAPAVEAQTGGGAAPDAFDVDASAVPVLIGASAPSALPLDVTAGVGFSGAKLNSQPKGTAEAAPGYVPLAGALPLLGGPGALPRIAVRLLPGLLVGFPTIVGLPPVPVDPTLIPTPDVPVFPAPPAPPLECIASVPGDTAPISCGGPTQDILGFTMGAASGTASAQGDPNDASTMRVDAAVRGGGFAPAPSNSLIPITAGSIASSATSSIKDGRVVAGVSTAVQDVFMFDSIKIPSMKTSISAALDGTPENASVTGERCTITGATVAGVPVTIDGDGVHAATQNQPLGAVLDPGGKLVQDTLNQLGVSLKTLAGSADPGRGQVAGFPGEATVSEDGTHVSASLACLQVSYRVPTSGSVFAFTFGTANLNMQAFTAVAPPSTLGASSSSVAPGASGSTASGASTVLPAGKSAASAVPAPSAPIAGAGAPAPSATPFKKVGFGWKIPYPPFGILALSVPLMIWCRRVGPVRVPRPFVLLHRR